MEQYKNILQWQWAHNSLASDLIRIFLGLALFVRGCLFIADSSALLEITQQTALSGAAYYVIAAHTIGGLLLALGLFTRIAALIQIPILIGAVFTIHIREGLFTPEQSLELAGLVLFLLIVILVFGPGENSLDYRFFGQKSTDYSDITITPSTA